MGAVVAATAAAAAAAAAAAFDEVAIRPVPVCGLLVDLTDLLRKRCGCILAPIATTVTMFGFSSR